MIWITVILLGFSIVVFRMMQQSSNNRVANHRERMQEKMDALLESIRTKKEENTTGNTDEK